MHVSYIDISLSYDLEDAKEVWGKSKTGSMNVVVGGGAYNDVQELLGLPKCTRGQWGRVAGKPIVVLPHLSMLCGYQFRTRQRKKRYHVISNAISSSPPPSSTTKDTESECKI